MNKTITANIAARKISKNGKTWAFAARIETFTRSESGKWTLTTDGAAEPVLESEVIDICRKATNWSAIKSANFAMDGFHA